jgi:hypothetical protein
MNNFAKVVFLLAPLSFCAGPVADALAQGKPPTMTTFKCKDPKGRTYYSDKYSSDCAQGEVQQLSRHGLKVTKPAARSATPGKPSKPVDLEQQRRDRALLATYGSEAQIDEARERNLALPAQAAKQADAKFERAQEELQVLHSRAEKHASLKQQLPHALIEEVREKEAQVTKLGVDAQRKRDNVKQIERRFDADKQRYRELSSQQAAASVPAKASSSGSR